MNCRMNSGTVMQAINRTHRKIGRRSQPRRMQRAEKNMNSVTWLDKLYEMELEWKEIHQKPFPI